jgi:hypothetical protein
VIHSMANIPPSYYHASAAIPTANHGDFFNTHAWLHQVDDLSCYRETSPTNRVDRLAFVP